MVLRGVGSSPTAVFKVLRDGEPRIEGTSRVPDSEPASANGWSAHGQRGFEASREPWPGQDAGRVLVSEVVLAVAGAADLGGEESKWCGKKINEINAD